MKCVKGFRVLMAMLLAVGLLAGAFPVFAQTPVDPDAALKAMEGQVFSTGPHGEQPTAASALELTAEELQQVKDMKATAAIVLHYGGNDWSNAQTDGLKARFAELGIEVIAVTDAGFKPEKQVSDIETVLAKKPNIIVSIPTDPVATEAAYKAAAAQGVKIVFMDNVPNNMEAGKDYISVVSADNYGNGVASAHLMAKALGGKGKIGVVFHAADFFVTKQRYEAFTKTIKDNYPEIEIVAEQGIGGPDFTGDAEKAAGAMMTKFKDLNGVWAVWDVPAEGVLAAARANAREDIIVTTIDLGLNAAVEIAKGGMIYGLGAQRPFDQGVTEATLAAYGLLGKEAPNYVALYALPVTPENVLDAWNQVYHADPPQALADAAKAGGLTVATGPDAALKAMEGQVFSTGPHGEQPTAASALELTAEELQQVKDMKATAAIVLHYGGNDWSNAQTDGLKARFAELGIEVIAVTDAGFKPEKQVSDIETVLAKKPNIIVSIPTDPVATEAAYKAAAAQGVKIVFMDNVPNNMEAGKDYISVVSADNYGNGVASAHLMAKALGGKGKIGVVFHAADFFVTKQRYEAFTKTIKDNYPEIEIVAEQGIGGPDFTGDAEKAAGAMMTKFKDLNGVWAVWDVPAEGVLAAARANAREDIIVTTIDLGLNAAVEIAKGGMIYGLGAQRPFDQGVTEATLAAYGLLGKEAPNYVALYALPVTPENVLDAWNQVYHADPPQALADAAKAGQ